jgi:ADP-heptose:LPS heptosyltransferase
LERKRCVDLLREARIDTALFAYPRPGLAFAAWRAGIPVRIGTAYRAYSPLFNRRGREHRKDATRHERDYNLSLLDLAGISTAEAPLPVLEISEALRLQGCAVLQREGIDPSRRFIVLHPGSGGSAKDWSPEQFGALAAGLATEAPECSILITGSASERTIMNRVAAAVPDRVVVLQEAVSLPELASILSLAELCLANSTGPLHIAAAVGTAVVGLYPFERVCNPLRWGPLGAEAVALTPEPALGCASCARRSCERHDRMERLGVDTVLSVALQKLAT